MGTPQPNRLPRILGSLLLGLVVAFGILQTTSVQTHVCTSVLNRSTQRLGMTWEVDNISIQLFPLRLNAEEIKIHLADGSIASIAAFESEVDAAAWFRGENRIRHLRIEGVEASIASTELLQSNSTEAQSPAVGFAIDELKVGRVVVTSRDSTLLQRLAWDRLYGSQIQWSPSGISGEFDVYNAALGPPNPPREGKSPLSAWNGTTTVDSLTVQAHPSDSVQYWEARVRSNWGGVEANAAFSSAELNLNVEWEPDPARWPIDSTATWSPTLKRAMHQQRLTAQLSFSQSNGAEGQFEWNGLTVPWNWQANGWDVGPVAVDAEAYASWAGVFGFALPSYVTDHRIWTFEVAQNQQNWHAKATPKGSRNKEISLAWDGGIERAELTATLRGFAIKPEGPELTTGRWMGTGNVYRDGANWHGSLHSSHPAGDALSTQWTAAWGDSTWWLETSTQIEQLSNAAVGMPAPWELHALLNWRASGTQFDSWVQIAELRNIVLLENGAPRVFNRFDAVQSKRGDAWSLSWDSDLTNGSIACNTAALNDWRFDPWALAWKPKGSASVALPEVEVKASFTNFQPVSLLANLPFTATEPFELAGAWRGRSGEVHAHIPQLTVGALDVEAIVIQGSSGIGKSDALTVSLGAMVYDGMRYVDELSADAMTDADGLSVFIQSLSGQWMNENFILSQPLRARWDKSTQLVSAEPFALRSNHGLITCLGNFASEQQWGLEGTVDVDSVSFDLGESPMSAVKLTGDWSVWSQARTPELNASFQIDRAAWRAFDARSLEVDISGPVLSPNLAFTTRIDSSALVEGAFHVPLNAVHLTEGILKFNSFPLRTINTFLPPASIEVDGVAHGLLAVRTSQGIPTLDGQITVEEAHLTVPYLGTHYGIHGSVAVRPEGFYMDQWRLVDRAGRTARFNGTALHSAFSDWNLDFGVDATKEPVELMNIPASDEALFYGKPAEPETSTFRDMAPICSLMRNSPPEKGRISPCPWTADPT